jgi:hypothetical protein
MVNGLRFTMDPTLCPFTILISSPWKKSPNIQPRIFVNSFSFIFSGVSHKDLLGNFFPWAKKAKKGGTQETVPDRPPEQGGPAGPQRQFAPVFPRNAPFLLPSSARKF